VATRWHILKKRMTKHDENYYFTLFAYWTKFLTEMKTPKNAQDKFAEFVQKKKFIEEIIIQIFDEKCDQFTYRENKSSR
jgi:hypothetical protein